MSGNIYREKIFELTREYYKHAFSEKLVPGENYIPASGKVFDERELVNLVDASLDFWLTEGRFNASFEKRLCEFTGCSYAATVNSGSSANLLAFYCLTSPSLGSRSVKRGDEVIGAATCFPTTLNPIIQYGCKPVLVDVSLSTYNPTAKGVLSAVTGKTKAIFLAHTLGNPYEVSEISKFCAKNGIWLIEDCCDALGAVYDGKKVGCFGHLMTLSFYPAHQITCGEGGAVLSNDAGLMKIVRSFRDWGRDCWCAPGKENTCGMRFEWQAGDLPKGYDHKYIYSHVGFNLKMTDMQAAVGLAQLDRLEEFVEKRRKNHALMLRKFRKFSKYFVLPKKTRGSKPSWFGFALTIKDKAPFGRGKLLKYLEGRGVGTRLLFGGNVTKQPAYANVDFGIPKKLKNADRIMKDTFWIGCYPAIDEATIDYVVAVFDEFLAARET